MVYKKNSFVLFSNDEEKKKLVIELSKLNQFNNKLLFFITEEKNNFFYERLNINKEGNKFFKK
jgi:hypothetical protein